MFAFYYTVYYICTQAESTRQRVFGLLVTAENKCFDLGSLRIHLNSQFTTTVTTTATTATTTTTNSTTTTSATASTTTTTATDGIDRAVQCANDLGLLNSRFTDSNPTQFVGVYA